MGETGALTAACVRHAMVEELFMEGFGTGCWTAKFHSRQMRLSQPRQGTKVLDLLDGMVLLERAAADVGEPTGCSPVTEIRTARHPHGSVALMRLWGGGGGGSLEFHGMMDW